MLSLRVKRGQGENKLPGPAMNWQTGNVAMSEGAGGRRLAPRQRVVWALSARALHGVWRRQEAGLETQVTARIRGVGAPRTRSQGGVREEMLPRRLGRGLNFRQQEEQDGPESRDVEGTWVDQGSGWCQGAFKCKVKPKWWNLGGPCTREACGGPRCAKQREPPRVFRGTPRPTAPESFLLGTKKHH